MTQSTERRSAPMRWIAALLVTIAMLVSTTGVAVFAQSSSSGGPVFAPATSVGYAEVRLDLPGDQREALAAFMAHFPGFADQASFETKLNEMLDQVVSQVSGGGTSWSANVAPWSNGQLAMAVLALPALDDNGRGFEDGKPDLVVAFGVADRAALETQIATLQTEPPTTTEEYQGATIASVNSEAVYAVTDRYLLVAPKADDLKASLDVLAGDAPSLADDAAFAVAGARIPANRLMGFYFSTAALIPFLEQLASQPGGEALLGQLDQMPAWMSGYAQAASDRLVFAGDVQYPSSVPVPAMRESDLSARFAPGQLAWVEVRDLGTTMHTTIEQLLQQMEAQAPGSTKQLDQVQAFLGVPLEEVLDPIEDIAFGFGASPEGRMSIGLAATLLDEQGAQQRMASVIALARMGLVNTPVTVTTTEVDGIDVTTFAIDAPDMSVTAMPIDPSISIAIGDGHLFIGSGDFASQAITRDPASSFASDARYQAALDIAGSPNAGLMWVDIAGIQSTIEGMGLADDEYTTEVKPWLDALDQVVVSSTTDQDGIVTGRMVLVVR